MGAGMTSRPSFDFDHRSSLDDLTQALLSNDGKEFQKKRQAEAMSAFRRVEFMCVECQAEIPPGREGRKCKQCRGL